VIANQIHIPGLIQPHGALWCCRSQLDTLPSQWNTLEILGHRPKELKNSRYPILLAPSRLLLFSNACEDRKTCESIGLLAISVQRQLADDSMANPPQDALGTLELERSKIKSNENDYSGTASGSPKASITKIQKSSSLLKMCEWFV